MIVGRDEPENRIIEGLFGPKDRKIEVSDIPGPVTLLLNSDNIEDIKTAAEICNFYSKSDLEKTSVNISNKDGNITNLVVKQIERDMIETFKID